ncbi:MAG TPA: HAMP domain-containing histidine kinase, partial [candidate division Zixibacteria bacterium]|nr:HAMP domain-containing histidine kinase [candidate division Zixibacteria bacterium]
LKELQPEKLTYELTNVYDTANEAINSVKMSMDPRKEVKFVNNLSKYLRVKCRRDHLRQIIVNLLTNSVDAIAEKGEIKIYQSDVPKKVVGQEELVGIVVEDTGGGIPKEIMENIFDPFFTTKQHGNGMGLAIVQAIANQYGGYVDVQNLDGQGAKFTVYLKAEKKNWG